MITLYNVSRGPSNLKCFILILPSTSSVLPMKITVSFRHFDGFTSSIASDFIILRTPSHVSGNMFISQQSQLFVTSSVVLTVEGNLTFSNGASTTISLENQTSRGFTVNGCVSFNGTLFVDASLFQSSGTYDVPLLNYACITGEFASVGVTVSSRLQCIIQQEVHYSSLVMFISLTLSEDPCISASHLISPPWILLLTGFIPLIS